jgi:hypothetical protein
MTTATRIDFRVDRRSKGLIEQVPFPEPVDRVMTLSQFSEIVALLGARSLAAKP